MNDRIPAPDPSGELVSADVGSLARELAAAYRQLVYHYREGWGLPAVEADAKARSTDDSAEEVAAAAQRTLDRPADEVGWWELAHLAERDPDRMAAVWGRIKAEACDEFASGHRAARALEWGGTPWDRARFLALRNAFRADVRPRGAVEAALVDALAESFDAYLKWTERLSARAESEGQTEDAKLQKEGYWQPPRLGVNEAIEQAATFAERAHRRFLLTLRALHELRRAPGVAIAHVGQVNIGGQQLNVAAPRNVVPADGNETVDA